MTSIDDIQDARMVESGMQERSSFSDPARRGIVVRDIVMRGRIWEWEAGRGAEAAGS